MQSVRRWEGGLARPIPLIAAKLEQMARELEAARLASFGPAHDMGSGQAQRTERGRVMGERQRDQYRGEFGLGGMFKGIGNLLELVSKMAEEGQEQVSRSGTFGTREGDVKGVYGFSVRLGLGGAPVVEEFGNLRDTASGPAVSDTREPLVDVLDEGSAVVVIAEMPGVDEKDIRTEVQGNVLRITAATGQRKYRKEVDLPAGVEPQGVVSSYRNGVLEVRLAKHGDGKAGNG